MQCSFCGKELAAGQACDCSGYQQFAQMQNAPPTQSAPPVAPPPRTAPPAPSAPPSAPPMTPPAQSAPPRSVPSAPPMTPPAQSAPPRSVPSAPPMTPPAQSAPPRSVPAAPPSAPPMTPPAQSTPPSAPPMTPPAQSAPPMTAQGNMVPPSYAQPGMPNYSQQPQPGMPNYSQQAQQGMPNYQQQGAPNYVQQGAAGVQAAAANINLEDAKKMTKQAGKKAFDFMHHIKNMLGFGPSAEEGDDPFEKGLAIVPEVSAACEGEIPVKQYRVANFRSRLQFLWAEGKVQVTNKRVIFRAAGRSLVGKTTLQQEYIIDEIAGVEISNGVRFDFFEFLLALILGFPIAIILMMKICGLFSETGDFFWTLMTIILAVAALSPYALLKGHLCIKAICTAAAASAFFTLMMQGEVFMWLAGLLFLTSLVMLFLFALRPSVSVAILSKAGTGAPIAMKSPRHFCLETAREMLPAEDIVIVQKELGAIISDIQKFGDYGIEKWKVQ